MRSVEASTHPETSLECATWLLFAIGIVLLPLQIWPPMALPGMQLADLFFAIAAMLFFVTYRLKGPILPAIAILVFLVGTAISATRGGSAIKLLGHLELGVLCWIALCASARHAFLFRRALVIAGAIAAATAMLGMLIFLLGWGVYDADGVPNHPLLYLHGALVAGDYPRLRGTLVTGAMLTAVVGTGFALLALEKELVPQRWLRQLIYVISIIAMFFAFSRAIASFAVVLTGFLLWQNRAARPVWIGWALMALVYTALLLISLRYEVLLEPTRLWETVITSEDGDRFGRWRFAVAAIAEHPFIGAGPGVLIADGWSAHNTWLNIWSILGLAPLIAFVALMSGAVWKAVRLPSLGLSCVLAFALISSLYNDVEDMRHLWIVMGLAIGLGAARQS
ncbi:MAG: hypothetical protein AAGH74_07420 [Pseudomonadota bacterium]